MQRKFFAVGIALAMIVWLSTSFNIPFANAQVLSPAEVLNADGTLNLTTGKTGTVNVSGWDIGLDPQRGPVFAPGAPTADGWASLNKGVSGSVFALAVNGSDVYVAGDFQQVCGNAACNNGNLNVNNIAKWNGSSWSALAFGVKGNVRALAVSNGELYVAGYFSHLCANAACSSTSTKVNNIARWTGNTWIKVSNGVNSVVNTLAAKGSEIYAGGAFTRICGNATCDSGNALANGIAKWSGASWSGLGYGMSGEVAALAVKGSTVYAGGSFSQVCGDPSCTMNNVTVNYIARWNGSSWSALGSGVNGFVSTVHVQGTNLVPVVYAGGVFTQVCGDLGCANSNATVNHVAKWTGNTWSAMGNGVDDYVYSFAFGGSDIYVGGSLTSICGNATCNSGNIKVNKIAKWNGSSWSALGDGVSGAVYALSEQGGNVYAGGEFKTTCPNADCIGTGLTVNRIAKYGALPPSPTPTPTPGCNAKPAKPTLQSPTNGATLASSPVMLEWNDVACETKYVAIVKDKVTNTKVFKTKLGENVVNTATGTLTQGKTYKWFVKACNNLGCTKSAVRTFTLTP